jgi:multicomponent Na+:H+ antiporter subunit B
VHNSKKPNTKQKENADMELYINMALLTMLAAVTVAIIVQRDLFSVVILSGIYSFLMASVLIVLDAVDVAMTEASVGAGISTVVLIGTLYLTGQKRELNYHRSIAVPLFVSLGTGAMLIWGTWGLPAFGIQDAPVHTHIAPTFLLESIPETGVPNVVTTVLADYRSFDTFGETTVIFTAGLGVMLLLGGSRRKKKKGETKS